MPEHVWIKYTMTPVDIDEKGNISVRESAREAAESSPAYGCGICDEPYTMNSTQECMGRKAEPLAIDIDDETI